MGIRANDFHHVIYFSAKRHFVNGSEVSRERELDSASCSVLACNSYITCLLSKTEQTLNNPKALRDFLLASVTNIKVQL